MLTGLAAGFVVLLPILVVASLLQLAAWRARVRESAIAQQIALTDAITGELGAVVAPVVTKPLWGPWQIEIAVPFARPATVGMVLAIAHRVLAFAERLRPGAYRIVLTPQETSAGDRAARRLTREEAVQGAMRGAEAPAVRAEFRQSGIAPPDRRDWLDRAVPLVL